MFERLFVPEEFQEAVSDRAWLEALLDVEAALARAEADLGVIPAGAAAAIVDASNATRFDPAQLAEDGRDAGNPVEPLVRALADAAGDEAGGYVHWGATSQDIVDTATMLVARNTLGLLLESMDAVAADCARLADAHRSTVMAGRTLLRQAVPTTFGLKAAGWLVTVLDARRGLVRIRDDGLAVQLGGAAGTLAALGERGLEVQRRFAEELELRQPLVPWHTNRVRVAELGSALAVAAGALAKIGLDVALLGQTEVGEARPSGGGSSSTMPHKQNPVGSALAIACARQVSAHASTLLASLPQEHERALGGWHAEWPALSAALAYAGGAAAGARRALEEIDADPKRMRANLGLDGGAVMSERAAYLLAERVGRRSAFGQVGEAASSGKPLADALELDPAELDPSSYLGAADDFVDRALAAYREEAM
jgi:3-carboxy-cis,cis-muconate cycloisomerase